MLTIIILAVSTILQFASAAIALSQIKLTAHKKAWIAISAAITLMAVRRTITFLHLISQEAYASTVQLESPEILAELVALCISILMLFGVIWITSLFHDQLETDRLAMEHEARFRSIFEVASTGIAICSPEGKLIETNPFLQKLLGYSAQELSEHTFESLLFKDGDESKFEEIFGDSSQVSIDREIQLVDKSGIPKWTRTTTAWVVDSSKKPLFRFIIINDISTTKKATAELLRSQKRLKEAEKLSKIGHWEIEYENGEGFWSDETYRIFEKDKDKLEASYDVYQDAIHPDDKEFVNKSSLPSLDSKIDNEITYRLLMKDGKIKFVTEKYHTDFDSDGKPVRSLGTIQDVTTASKATAELLKSQARLKEAENISKIGHWEEDLKKNETLWSDELYKILEINKINFKPCDEAFMDFVHPDDRELVNNAFSSSINDNRYYEITYRLLMANGKIKFVIEKCRIELGKDGAPIHSFGTVQDVTKMIEAEKTIRVSEELFSKAFRATPYGLAITSIEKGRIVEVNDGFKKILGYTNEEAIGKTTRELNLWPNPEDRDILIKKIEAEGFVKDYPIKVRSKEGKLLDCMVSTERITINRESCMLSEFRDVTEQNRINEEVKRLRRQIELENEYLREEVSIKHSFKNIVGNSRSLREVLEQVETVAKSDATVLIHGASGTGKELIARAIHEKSNRSARPLVTLSCASIPHNLFESELFGHTKGAFTGAHIDRVGRFELAKEGTLFLDEISEIPLELQSTLLRVIQEKEFERIGHGKTQKTNVRIISATNRDLKKEVEKGTFREDLYFRLNVFPIFLSPLRERKEDIALLADHFLRIYCKKLKIPEKTLKQKHIVELESYNWPGNIRELQNVIERAVITSREGPLVLNLLITNFEFKDLKENLNETLKENPQEIFTFSELKKIERTNIVAALNETDWKISGKGGAAELLSVKPNTLTSRIKALDITKDLRS